MTVTSQAMSYADLLVTANRMFSVPHYRICEAAVSAKDNGSADLSDGLAVLWRQRGTSEVYYLVYKTGTEATR